MTIKDIAKISGVSVSTVSRVLNNHPDVSEDVRRKVMAVVEEYNPGFTPNNKYVTIKEVVKAVSDTVDIMDAKVLVSGGRGVGSAENFKILEDLAEVMGGTVSCSRAVVDSGWSAASLVYWVTGVIGGVAVNASALNMPYDGEFTVNVDYTQTQLERCIDAGEFTLHKVGADIRVLNDQNSLVTTSVDKNELFKQNQTIRVIDNIANDIATIFNTKYLGQIPNDDEGRVSLWADIVAHHQELQRIRAIQDFEEDDVVVSAGTERAAVVVNDAVTPVNAMAKLYMTCVVQ